MGRRTGAPVSRLGARGVRARAGPGARPERHTSLRMIKDIIIYRVTGHRGIDGGGVTRMGRDAQRPDASAYGRPRIKSVTHISGSST